MASTILSDTEWTFLLYGAGALFILGIVLSYLARPKGSADQGNEDELVSRLNKALPGIQCAQCGYPGCAAYAQALANGEVSCNKCTPGGQDTIDALAEILGVDSPLEEDSDDAIFAPRTVAVIHASTCIGCTKCKRHCPVDAIEGTAKNPHYILENECIGCNDCVKHCPVKCIELVRLEPTIANYNWELRPIRFKGGAN